MARPRGVVAWSVIRAVDRVGQGTCRKVYGQLSGSVDLLRNADRYAGLGAELMCAARRFTQATVQRVMRTLAHYRHIAAVDVVKASGVRRPLSVYGLIVPAGSAASMPHQSPDVLVQVMGAWGGRS